MWNVGIQRPLTRIFDIKGSLCWYEGITSTVSEGGLQGDYVGFRASEPYTP